MNRLLALALALIAGTAFAQTPKVAYSVAACSVGTNTKLTAIQSGQSFDLVFYAQDLRPDGTWYGTKTVNGQQVTGNWPLVRGMFACYADVLYDRNLVKVTYAYSGMSNSEFKSCFTFKNGFTNGVMASDAADRIDNIGAFTSYMGMNTAPVEIWRIRMSAKNPGGLVFTPSVSDLMKKPDGTPHPATDTLVYGNIGATPPDNGRVDPSQIVLIPHALTIVR